MLSPAQPGHRRASHAQKTRIQHEKFASLLKELLRSDLAPAKQLTADGSDVGAAEIEGIEDARFISSWYRSDARVEHAKRAFLRSPFQPVAFVHGKPLMSQQQHQFKLYEASMPLIHRATDSSISSSEKRRGSQALHT